MNTNEMKIKMVWNKLQMLNEFPLEYVRREIALTVFEMSTKYSGMISTSLTTDQGFRITGKGTKYTKEHFHNMKKYCIIMCEKFLSGEISNLEELTSFIEMITQVHYVTSEENTQLRLVQTSNPELSWQDHYRLAGITLVEERGTYNKDSGKKTLKK